MLSGLFCSFVYLFVAWDACQTHHIIKYTPEPVIETETHVLYWDRTIRTDRETPCNQPDITVYDKETGRVQLVDIAVPGVSNMRNTHTEKTRKYRELAEQMRKVWRATSVEIIPIILSSNGLVHKEVKNGPKKLGLQEHLVTRMQKSVIINSCGLVRRVLGE